MTLWRWAVATYDRPGVKDALLDLQNQHGVDVPLLLWRLWLHEHGRAVEAEAEARALAFTREWREKVVGPLRSSRNALDVIEADGARRLRIEVLEAELFAEKVQLENLEALPTAPAPETADLAAALAGWRELQSVPPTEFSPLLAALATR